LAIITAKVLSFVDVVVGRLTSTSALTTSFIGVVVKGSSALDVWAMSGIVVAS
jgi:hypothetical protein